MAYASVSDLIERYDSRTVGELVSDSGSRVTGATLLTDTNASTALDDASGAIDAALLNGGRYSASDLSGLSGNALAHLKRITCDIAMSHLFARRPAHRSEERKAIQELAAEHLEQLSSGKDVFNISANITASNPTIDGPTTVQVNDLNMLRDRVGTKFYPARHLPNNR